MTGVCTRDYNCVISEFGIKSQTASYITTGFNSIYVTAHEMGHKYSEYFSVSVVTGFSFYLFLHLYLIASFGMSHDSSGNACSPSQFVMSPSRGTTGKTVWSSCSAQKMRELK